MVERLELADAEPQLVAFPAGIDRQPKQVRAGDEHDREQPDRREADLLVGDDGPGGQGAPTASHGSAGK